MAYRSVQGHCNSYPDLVFNGYYLGSRVGKQRQKLKKKSLEEKTKLDDRGVVWDPLRRRPGSKQESVPSAQGLGDLGWSLV